MYVTTEAVETFVERHYAEQITRLREQRTGGAPGGQQQRQQQRSK